MSVVQLEKLNQLVQKKYSKSKVASRIYIFQLIQLNNKLTILQQNNKQTCLELEIILQPRMVKIRDSKMSVIVHKVMVKVQKLYKILYTELMLHLNGLKILKLVHIKFSK